MRKIVVLEEAAEDIERGREFYNQQEIGVGAYFEDTILSDIESLGLFHGIHSKHFGFHRLLSERFPFGIYYRETPTATEVFAILDLRRNPKWIRENLKGRNTRSDD
ncbi:MAG: type II toxin-antitoxin system RelE/ParE family toxin [Verrucomicrobiota bacterium]